MAEKRNVNLTPEYLKKIQAFTAIKPDEVFDYTPIAFRDLPEDLRPIFELRVIAGDELVKMEDVLKGSYTYTDDGKGVLSFQRGEFAASICRKGIIGWSNYYNYSGEIILYVNNISCLPPDLLYEICNAITERTRITKEEQLGLK